MTEPIASALPSSEIVRWSKTRGPRRLPARFSERAPSNALKAALRLHRRGRHADAVTAYLAALDGDPGDLDAWMGLGVATALLGHASLARNALERAFELAVELPTAARARLLRDRGVALLAIGQVERGVASLTDATRARPDDLGSALVLAESLHDHGALDRARLIQPFAAPPIRRIAGPARAC